MGCQSGRLKLRSGQVSPLTECRLFGKQPQMPQDWVIRNLSESFGNETYKWQLLAKKIHSWGFREIFWFDEKHRCSWTLNTISRNGEGNGESQISSFVTEFMQLLIWTQIRNKKSAGHYHKSQVPSKNWVSRMISDFEYMCLESKKKTGSYVPW